MNHTTIKTLIITILGLALWSNLAAQSETEISTDGIVVPRLSASAVTSPVEGQVIYDTDTDELSVYNGTSWISLSSGGFWQPSASGITYNNEDNVGIGANANSGTKLFVQGDYNEDPFRVQIGLMGDPNGGSTKMRILAKFNSMVFGSSWNTIDSTHLDALWSNYAKNYFRDSVQLRNPAEDPAILLTKGSGVKVFDNGGNEVIALDRTGLATLDDLSVNEEASFGKGLLSSDPIKLREIGNGPAGPEILFMDDNSTTNDIASIKVTNSTGGGNNHNMIIENKSSVGDIQFIADGGTTHFRMDNGANFSYVPLSPWLTNTTDLGSTSKRWRTIYAQNALNTSDLRLKKNIKKLSKSVLNDLMKLEATTYHYKSDDADAKKSIGFLAQEVEKINPDWVIPPKTEDDHYLINYNNFTIIAIKAIQEQQEVIDSLQKEISNIKKQLVELTHK